MKILFITHDFTKTGAPTLLLRILKVLQYNEGLEIDVATIYDRGELKKEFLSVGSIYHGSVKDISFFQKKRIKKGGYDLIFLNTIVAGEVIKDMSQFAPCVVWVHEMMLTIEKYGSKLLDEIVKCSEVICVVDRVTQNAIGKAKKVHLLRGAVDSKSVELSQTTEHIQNDNFNLHLVATPIWRKGVFSIPEVIQKLPAMFNLHWYGTDSCHKVAREIAYSADLIGHGDKVNIHGFKSKLWSSMNPANSLHLVLAHEEPGPLTILEAAQIGIPSICWDKGVGLADFVADDCGWVVEYLNFEQMGNLFREIKENPQEINRRGENARKKVLAEFTAEIRAEELLSLLETVVNTMK